MSNPYQYRKKPVIVEAFKIPSVDTADRDDIEMPDWIFNAQVNGTITLDHTAFTVSIKTLEGVMIGLPGDYIIQGIKGELYPCKSDIFETTYEKVEQ